MRKMTNKKGFTLMEMLIVVAIIAILVAIAIPTFNSSLNKARVATDEANIRAAYAEVMTDYITKGNVAEQKKQVTMTGVVNAGDKVDIAGFTGTWGKGDIIIIAVDADGVVSITNGGSTGNETTTFGTISKVTTPTGGNG